MKAFFYICIIGFCIASSSQMIAPIIAIYSMDYLGASITEVGLITSTFFISAACSRLPTGLFVRRRRGAFLFSLIILTMLPSAYTLASNPHHMVIIRVIHGFALALYGPIGLAIATLNQSLNERGRAITAYTTCIALGLIVGPAITTFSIGFFRIQSTFYIASMVAAMGLTAALLLMRVEGVGYGEEGQEEGVIALRDVLTNQFFIVSFISFLSFSFLHGVLLAYAPLYARSRFNLSDGEISSMFFGYFLLTAISRLFINKLIHTMRKRMIVCVGLANTSINTILLFLSQTPQQFQTFFTLIGLSHGIIYPTAALITAEAVKPTELILANSIYLNAFDLGTMMGPLTMAPIAEGLGLAQAIVASSIPPIIGILAVTVMSRPRGGRPKLS